MAGLWLDSDAYARGKSTLTVGGGIFAEGERFTSPTNGVRMPAYATVDLSARYGFDYEGGRMNLQAGIKNVFDCEYSVGGFGEGIFFRGQPRTLYLQLSAGF